jgi:hypothetical protein
MSFGFFPSRTDIRREMSRELSRQIPQILKELGFLPVRPAKKDRLPLNWHRDRANIIDALMFQWDKYNRPSLIINFRSFTHEADIALCRKDPKEIAAWDFGLRAHMKPSVFGWFKTSYFHSLFNSDAAINAVTEKMKRSLSDIDNVMKGGTATTPMQDSSRWLDPRLPDSPPPWTWEYGKIPSAYHLPPYRVGKGDKLATWEL